MQHYIGVDLHKSSFNACAVDERGARIWEDRYPRTEVAISSFLARCSKESVIAVEASGPTWSFADRIIPTVGRLYVIDAGRTKLKAGYAAKTDRLDARRLADALRRDSVVGIYIPPPEIRDLREMCRYRIGLVRNRTALKQRMHALLLRQGLEFPDVADLFGREGRKWLDDLELGGWAGQGLHGYLQLFDETSKEIERIEAAMKRQAAADAIVVALQTLKGIGPILGMTIRAEIGTADRFKNASHLSSYAGLVPSVDSSGRRVHYGPLTKRGCVWLRWALIEAATHGLKRDDDIGSWARRLAMQKGILKARPAIARVLCADILRVWPRTV